MNRPVTIAWAVARRTVVVAMWLAASGCWSWGSLQSGDGGHDVPIAETTGDVLSNDDAGADAIDAPDQVNPLDGGIGDVGGSDAIVFDLGGMELPVPVDPGPADDASDTGSEDAPASEVVMLDVGQVDTVSPADDHSDISAADSPPIDGGAIETGSFDVLDVFSTDVQPICSPGCSPTTHCCNGVCVNLQTDPNNCGACGMQCCPSGAGACSSGACMLGLACSPGTSCCFESTPVARYFCATGSGCG